MEKEEDIPRLSPMKSRGSLRVAHLKETEVICKIPIKSTGFDNLISHSAVALESKYAVTRSVFTFQDRAEGGGGCTVEMTSLSIESLWWGL